MSWRLVNCQRMSWSNSMTPSLMLSSTVCMTCARALDVVARRGRLGARPLGGVARGFGRLLGGRQRLLALFQLGDVAVDAEHAAVVQPA